MCALLASLLDYCFQRCRSVTSQRTKDDEESGLGRSAVLWGGLEAHWGLCQEGGSGPECTAAFRPGGLGLPGGFFAGLYRCTESTIENDMHPLKMLVVWINVFGFVFCFKFKCMLHYCIYDIKRFCVFKINVNYATFFYSLQTALTESRQFPDGGHRAIGLVRRPTSLPAALWAKPDGMFDGKSSCLNLVLMSGAIDEG